MRRGTLLGYNPGPGRGSCGLEQDQGHTNPGLAVAVSWISVWQTGMLNRDARETRLRPLENWWLLSRGVVDLSCGDLEQNQCHMGIRIARRMRASIPMQSDLERNCAQNWVTEVTCKGVTAEHEDILFR